MANHSIGLGGAGVVRGSGSATLTVANNTDVSDGCFVEGACMFGAIFPSGLDWATVTFEVSRDGTTWTALYDYTGATQVSMAVAASRAYDLPGALCAFEYWRFKGNTNQAPALDIFVVGKG